MALPHVELYSKLRKLLATQSPSTNIEILCRFISNFNDFSAVAAVAAAVVVLFLGLPRTHYQISISIAIRSTLKKGSKPPTAINLCKIHLPILLLFAVLCNDA